MHDGDQSGLEHAREIALGALARRDLSEAALRARLHSAGITSAAVDETLDALSRTGLVDDPRLAASRAAKLADRGYGNDAIESRLDHEGFDPSVIRDALRNLPPEEERALAFSVGVDQRRLGPILFRRGFGEAAVELVLARREA